MTVKKDVVHRALSMDEGAQKAQTSANQRHPVMPRPSRFRVCVISECYKTLYKMTKKGRKIRCDINA